jgi:hypothetical protein
MLLFPHFVAEIGGRKKILLSFLWWSAVDTGQEVPTELSSQ